MIMHRLTRLFWPHFGYFLIFFGVIYLTSLIPAAAEPELPRPTGKLVLTVTGKITRTNAPGKAEFDWDLLNSLGIHQLKTSTPWTEGTPTFEGVLARDLMAAVGATGSEVKATALNDYVSVIPLADFDRYDVLLAVKMNGKTLSRRDKGPIWIMYPLDKYPEVYDLGKIPHLVWQLTQLEVQ